ncbi:flagellar hook-basal body complex protein FliE [candidate division GN15 bacterium]|nr:flagellar hook-basal body complex protein FliE [candidate division GN15 bacterium]
MSNSITNINRLVPGLIEQGGASKPESSPVAGPGQPKFADLVSDLLNDVNELQNEAGQIQQAFLAGEPVELHEVMIKAEEAGLSMDLLLEIRNKLVNAYNEIIRMPM